MEVRQLAGEYLGALRVQGYSPNTVRNYALALETFISHTGEEGRDPISPERRGPRAIDHACLIRFLQTLRLGGRRERTLQTYKTAISSWYRWLIQVGRIDRNPVEVLGPIRAPEPDPRPIPPEDMRKVLEGLGGLNWRSVERNRAILELFYASGLRLMELVNLDIGDVNLDTDPPYVVVRQGKGKKDGIGMLTPAAVAAIKAWLPNRARLLRKWEKPSDSPPLFLSRVGDRIGKWRVWDMIVDAGKKILGKRITTHQFRHSFCTDLLNNGADLESIRKLARHESLSSTQKYLNVSTEHLKSAYAKHPRNRFHEKAPGATRGPELG